MITKMCNDVEKRQPRDYTSQHACRPQPNRSWLWPSTSRRWGALITRKNAGIVLLGVFTLQLGRLDPCIFTCVWLLGVLNHT